MASVLNESYFHDEKAAFEALETILWPNGPICPLCGCHDSQRIGSLVGVRSKPSKKHPGGVERHGLKKCYQCRGQFTVRKGTVFEASHLQLHQWFQAAYLLCSSKKGISSNQLARTLRCTVKTAWFASHRIREAMREGELAVPFGSGGGAVEVDETFIGRKKGIPKKAAYHHKMKVLTLVDRETGRARSTVVETLSQRELGQVMRENISKEARLMTDEATHYQRLGLEYVDHQVVHHGAEEYVRGEAHTNTAEGFFSVFKRGMKGTYQHCREGHLHRYLIVTSALTIAEVLWRRGGPKLATDKLALLRKFFRRSHIRVVNVSRVIAEEAQDVVMNYNVRPKDAVHVATAIHHDISILETFDDGLLAQSGQIGVAPLLIRKPIPVPQGELEFGR